jgi:hypothetical protein
MPDELEAFLGFIQPSRFTTRLGVGARVLHLALEDRESLLETARAVGPQGVVVGVHESLEVLDTIWEQVKRAGLENVYLIQANPLGFVTDEPVDAVIS